VERPIEELVTAGRLDLLLERHANAKRIGERRYLLDAIERALILADPGAVSSKTREQLAGLGIARALLEGQSAPVPPHAVVLPFVTESGLGFGRLVFVSTSSDLRGGAVAEALRAAAALAKPKLELERYGLAFAQPAVAPRLDVSGRSLGAATFVSAVALFSRRQVEAGTSISGELVGEKIGSVGGLSSKLEGCFASRADLRRAIVPSRNAASVRAVAETGEVEVLSVTTTKALLERALAPRGPKPRDPESAVADARRTFRSGWDGYRWPTQREPLERLLAELPEHRPDLRVEALTMMGAVSRHLGAPDESAKILARARAIVESPLGDEAVPDEQRSLLAQHEALTFAKLCRFPDATDAAEKAIASAKRGRLRGELLKAHGCAGLVALARGRAASAVKHQRHALSIVVTHRPSGASRTAGYLIEALGRAGRLDEARETYREAKVLLGEMAERRRSSREAWLRVAWAGALSHGGEQREVARVLRDASVGRAIEETPLPGLVARRLLGIALASRKRPEAGWELLAASPAAHGRGLLPHVRFLAQLNVLVEARLRAERDALGADAIARALTALSQLPRYGEAPRFLGPARLRVERALSSANADKVRRALEALLNRALRLT
jgi:pentatricopeptide repeat protein